MLHKRIDVRRPILSVLSRGDYRGKWRLYRLLQSLGLLTGTITRKIGGHDFLAPADAGEFWNVYDRPYDRRLVALAQEINELGCCVLFMNMGANTGIWSAQIGALCSGVNKIVAVEPNPKCFSLLKMNLFRLAVAAEAINAAVSDYDGDGKFSFDATIGADHAGHLTSNGMHEVRVVRADSICNDPAKSIALKIDVEGAERDAIRGARRLIEQAANVIVFVEVHPETIHRSEVAAEEIFTAAEAIRPFSWRVAGAGALPVSRTRPFFDQFPDTQEYDVIGVSQSKS